MISISQAKARYGRYANLLHPLIPECSLTVARSTPRSFSTAFASCTLRFTVPSPGRKIASSLSCRFGESLSGSRLKTLGFLIRGLGFNAFRSKSRFIAWNSYPDSTCRPFHSAFLSKPPYGQCFWRWWLGRVFGLRGGLVPILRLWFCSHQFI